MTKILPGKPVIRETSAFDYTDAIVVELHPKHLVVRVKRLHNASYELDYTEILRYVRKLAYVKAAR